MALTRNFILTPSLCLAAGLACAQASSLQLEGSVGAGLTYKNHQAGNGTLKELAPNLLVASYLRIGGTEALGGAMKAIYRLESSLALDTGNPGGNGGRFFNRQSWVGVDLGAAGALTLGRQFHAATDRAIRSYDVYNVGGTSLHNTPLALFGVNRFAGNDTRVDNSVKYRLGIPGTLDFAVSLGLGEAVDSDALGRSWSAELSRTTAAYSVGVSYVSFNAPARVAATGALPKHELLAVGGNLRLGAFRPYLAYYSSQLDATVAGRPPQKNRIVDVGLEWTLGLVRLKGNYVDDKGTDLNGTAGRNGSKKTVVLSTEYALSRRTSLNAAVFSNRFSGGYRQEAVNLAGLGRDPAASSVGGFSAGMVHTF